MARVQGQVITRRELERTEASLRNRYESLLRGAPLPNALDLRARALDELIEAALVRHEADRLGLEVSNDELDQAIMSMPEFQENGRFNRELVERVLRFQRDRGEFEAQLRETLLQQRLQSLVTDGVQVADGEVEERYRLDHERVDLAFVRIAAAPLADGIVVGDDELQKYLADHADSYRVPARVRARYVVYRSADFAPQVQVPDDDITRYYEDHRYDRFTEPEQVHARHILIKVAPGADDEVKAVARKKAADLLARAKAGEDFAALAKKHSEDPGSAGKGGDLGLFPQGRMVPEFDRAAFSLEPGQLSDVVETPFGFHIIKVEEHRAADAKPLEAVRDEILQTLRTERGFELARQQAEADRRQVVRGKPFAEAVGGRPVQETAPFAASDPVPGVGHVPGFAEAAFALADGELSDLVESDDAVYLLAPFDHVDAHVPPLAEVRDRVSADARRERAEAAARQRGEALQARAKQLGLERAAGEAGLAVDTTGPFDRTAASLPKLGAAGDLRTDAFRLTSEAPLAPKVYVAGGDAVVAALRERTPADMSGLAAAKDRLHDSLLQQKRYAALTAYLNELKQRAESEGALEVRADALGRG